MVVSSTSNSKSLSLLLLFAVCTLLAHSRSAAQLLPPEEVKTLQTIATKLNYKHWKVDQNSCSRAHGLNVSFDDGGFSNVTCNCTFERSTICHVTNILLKGLNLTGTVPAEFGNLSYLQEIDLSRNYIDGSIPTSLSKLPLLNLTLLGNRITGQIPKEMGDITTLKSLVLEDNELSGPLPESLGNLSRLSRLFLSANNFTGTIPVEYGNLKNLTDFRIDGSTLSGKIPDFVGNWLKITRLDMQGTSMNGPIPSAISSLTRLIELRISDLSGSNIEFPDLRNLTNLKYLILRNCLIAGSIPEYIGQFGYMKILDLSFNKLTGRIPGTLENLDLNYLFLTNNFLTGIVPSSIMNNRKNFDLSYNNFTGLPSQSCAQADVNLISSYSSVGNNQINWCFKKGLPCSTEPQYHSLFINCGGENTAYEGSEYEGDSTAKGPSTFFSSSEKWAYSSTGVYMGNDKAGYTARNTNLFNSSDAAEIYGTARLAPISLKYYGLCMKKGSYTVRLHFAEIMFSNNETFSSVGRRIFDISIQGKRELKDFNIVKEAKGEGKGIVKSFNDVLVNGTTLEIHLYWSGKGTTAIPNKGVYGPLISAISVTPNFDVDKGLSVGVIVAIVVASCVFVALILAFLRTKGCLGKKDVEDKELRALELQTYYFTLRQIKAATANFDAANKIGEGGFGPVYKGVLSDGAVIAVKQLSSKSKQGNREFVNEIGMISALQHPNLVRLYGCCIEGNQLLLIYEYMENNSLARALFGPEEQRLNLNWPTRLKICMGIARGLAYLHEESRLKIVHRDIKATNVLLDRDLNAKISDFGLAKLDEEENTHISTRIAGTIGYMAPEYAMRGYLTDKADVYSFGIVALEIVSGKSNTNYKPKEEFVYLLDWAYVLQEQGNLLDLVDPTLGPNYSVDEAKRMLNLALLCTNPSPTLRPAMSLVVSMLEGNIPVQPPVVTRSSMEDDMRFKAFERLAQDSQVHASTSSWGSQEQRSISEDGPWIDSTVSIPSKETLEHSSSRKLLSDH